MPSLRKEKERVCKMNYRKVDLEQSSQKWLDWRNTPIGSISATDASTIMGVNPYDSVYDLWAVKVGLKQRIFKDNEPAVVHGKNTEEEARKAFIQATDISMIPVCVERLDYPFLKASLDGINEEKKVGLEIKCPMFFASFRKQKDEVSAMYYSQIQHQLLCCGSEFSRWILYVYFENQDAFHVVKRDEKFQKELLKRCLVFHTLVKNKIEPTGNVFAEYVL